MFSPTRSAILAAALACVSAASCSSNKYAMQGQPTTTLVVRNDNWLEHTVYLLYGSQRIRLGTARSNQVTKFVIPPQYVFGVSSLQFLLDPIGARGTPVSDRVNVSPGDEIDLTIPPFSSLPTATVLSRARPEGP